MRAIYIHSLCLVWLLSINSYKCRRSVAGRAEKLQSTTVATLVSGLSVASVIAVHEAGHFFAGKILGVKIESFNVGFGPKLISYRTNSSSSSSSSTRSNFEFPVTNLDDTPVLTETEICLRAIPLGGYVSFPNNVERDDDGQIVKQFTDPDLLQNRSPLQRSFVISAGVLANIMLTFLLSTGASWTYGTSTPVYGDGIVISAVSGKESPASVAGLRANDIILKLNDQTLVGSELAVESFVSAIRSSEGREVTLQVARSVQNAAGEAAGTQTLTVPVVPAANSRGRVSIGVGINAVVTDMVVSKAGSLPEAIGMGAQVTSRLIGYTCDTLWKTVTSAGLSGADLGGPIAVVSAGAKLAEYSPAALIGFIASLSVNLAVINALPFPALDGGQLVYVLFELLLRRPVPRRVQEVLTGLSALVLVALGVTTFVGDVQRLGDPGNDVKVERSATVPGDR